MYYSTVYQSPAGVLTLACDREGERLAGLWVRGQKHFGGGLAGEMREKSGVPLLETTKKWLERYFAGERPGAFELPLAPAGSDFRQEVWNILRKIAYGEVTTYGAIAEKIARKNGKKSSARAVGGAVGHNPISIIIPCHRVVGADGGLTGYAGGIGMKIKLLELEGTNPASVRKIFH